LLRLQISNAEAIGDPRSAWEIEQRLLLSRTDIRTNVRAARILQRAGDRMDCARRYSAENNLPRSSSGLLRGRILQGGEKDVAKGRLLFEAQALYSQG
jgi:hypothetical protein